MGYKALNEVKPLFKVYVWQGLFEVVVWIHICFLHEKNCKYAVLFLRKKMENFVRNSRYSSRGKD